MARSPISITPPSVVIETILRDIDGSPILELRYGEYIVRLPDGTQQMRKTGESILLSCGTMWNPGMMARVPVGVCDACRHPEFRGLRREAPRHGTVTLQRARMCASCGRLCCPRHFRRLDGHLLCLKCASGFWPTLKRFLAFLLFTRG